MIQITHNEPAKRWEARFKYNPEDLAKVKTARWRWEPNGKFWWTDQENKYLILKELINPSEEVNCPTDLTHPEVEPINIPLPEGISARDYQSVGVAFLSGREKSLLADDMGLGKSFQAIGIFNLLKPRRTLVICPASLCINWQREFTKFGVNLPPIQVVKSTKSEIIKEGIVIINFEKVVKMHSQLSEDWWDLAIYDESHKLKNPKAAVTKHVYGKYHKDPDKRILPISKKKLLLMTGTPMLSRPSELWTTVKEIDPTGLGKDWHTFHRRYCDAKMTRYGWDVSGATNRKELGEKMAKFTIRRKKDDVLTELPEAIHQIIPFEATKEQERLILKERNALEMIEVDPTNPKIAIHISEISELRQAIALTKVKQIVEMCESIVSTGQKVVIGAHHRKVIEEFQSKIKDSVVLYGGMTSKQKQAVVDDFQKEEGAKVFIGSIQAAGVGITLTASSSMIFAEYDWTPGNILQFCDRIRRIGQKQVCSYKYPTIMGSFDENMLHKWMSKKSVIEDIIG